MASGMPVAVPSSRGGHGDDAKQQRARVMDDDAGRTRHRRHRAEQSVVAYHSTSRPGMASRALSADAVDRPVSARPTAATHGTRRSPASRPSKRRRQRRPATGRGPAVLVEQSRRPVIDHPLTLPVDPARPGGTSTASTPAIERSASIPWIQRQPAQGTDRREQHIDDGRSGWALYRSIIAPRASSRSKEASASGVARAHAGQDVGQVAPVS